MNHPELLQKAEAKELNRVLQEYPYSGILQTLYLKALKNQNNYLYPKQLKRAAISVPDRKLLHNWVEIEIVEEIVEEDGKSKIVFKPTEAEKPIAKEAKTESIPPKKVVPPATPVEIKREEVEIAKTPIPVAVPSRSETSLSEPIKEDDLDLANLPASIRETVLRARKIRRQLEPGEKTKEAETKVEEAPVEKALPQEIIAPVVEIPVPVPEVIPAAPIYQEPTIIEEPEPVPIPTVVETPREVEAEPELAEEVVEATNEGVEAPFELSTEYPIVPGEQTPQDVYTEAERHSFIGWLQGAKPDDEDVSPEPSPEIEVPFTISPNEEIKPTPKTEMVQELYETFMEKPRIKFNVPGKEKKIDMFELSTSAESDYITETLAQVYVQQKLYNRAVNAYEILRLKYPEKSSFFAAQILEIKQLLKEKD